MNGRIMIIILRDFGEKLGKRGSLAVELAAYDLYPPLLLGAFLGSLVYIAAQDGPPRTWWHVFSPIVAGTLTGNYLPHLIIAYILGEQIATGAGGAMGAFAVGSFGPWGARMLIRRAKSWNPPQSPPSNNGRSPTP